MFCSKCGAQIPDGSEFCPKCGAQVSGAAGSTGTIVKNSKKKKPGCLVELGRYVVFVEIFCVVCCLVHWFYFNRISHAAGLLKQQVELCYLERGTLCGCDGYSSGKGWDLGEAVREAESSFLITRVKIKNGVINMYPVHISLPKARCRDDEVFKGSFVPYTSSGGRAAPLDWSDTTFTCIKENDNGFYTQRYDCEK